MYIIIPINLMKHSIISTPLSGHGASNMLTVCWGITGGMQVCCISINLSGRGGGKSKKYSLYENVIIKFESPYQL